MSGRTTHGTALERRYARSPMPWRWAGKPWIWNRCSWLKLGRAVYASQAVGQCRSLGRGLLFSGKSETMPDAGLLPVGLPVFWWCVRLALRLAALVVCCFGLSFWLGGGLHMGWSKSTETRTEIDEVTGLEYPVTVSKYVFGVELLGAALGVSGGLFGLSFAFCKPARPGNRSGAEISMI